MSPHIYAVKQGEMDGSAYAVLRNRDDYFAQSAATVNRLPAHPPVPRARALVPVASCGTAWGDSDSPDVTDDREPEQPNEE